MPLIAAATVERVPRDCPYAWRMSFRLIVFVAFALAVAACSGADEPAATSTTTTRPSTTVGTTETPLRVVPSNYAEFRAQATACAAVPPPPVADLSFTAPDDMGITGPVEVTIVTSCGPIVAVLDPAAAPETVNSFVFLAEAGFFDGSVSHRVFPDFIVQAGDPTATGFGGPGYAIADEFPAADFQFSRGVLAMANAGPGTTGSQFFIMLSDASLPPQFSVFGSVVDGFEAMDAIAAVPLGAGPTSGDPVPTTPLQTVYIERVNAVVD